MSVRFSAFLFFFCLIAGLFADAEKADAKWYFQAGNRGETPFDPASGDASLTGGGSLLIACRADRRTFRPSRERFNAAELTFSVTASGDFELPLKAWIFVKDKDGQWYQSEREFQLRNGVAERLSVRLDQAGRNLLPDGHGAPWSAEQRAGIFEMGLSVYTSERAAVSVHIEKVEFSGEAARPALAIGDWRLPERAASGEMFESRFQLTREYFNPFDPDEIEVDFEVIRPGEPDPQTNPGKAEDLESRPGTAIFPSYAVPGQAETALEKGFPTPARVRVWLGVKDVPEPEYLRYPAFYTRDFRRDCHFSQEILSADGAACWAFRMYPSVPGRYWVRLRVCDRSGERPVLIYSPWRQLEVEAGGGHGAVGVSPRNRHYFEFADGTFFFPVSLNIHANTDRRSEGLFKWGELPDRGTYDYEDYFDACGRAGITMIEVWMASWTYAIEWDAARRYYAGAGRYSLANAWRLDRLFASAKKNGIYLNLVLDSHGKMSDTSDQEWDDHPYNGKGPFAAANGGFLEKPQDFWSNFRAQDLNMKRNRYIAARWGAEPQVFAFEFWSEVDIVRDGGRLYRDGILTAWHRRAFHDFAPLVQACRLFSTHTCGTCDNSMGFRSLCVEFPEFTHIASDAYRNPEIHIANQLKRHTERMGFAGRPMIVTEYGGTSGGSADEHLTADIHSGLWAAFFLGQAATPALWWHDFVHLRNLYLHYRGFADFIRDIDPVKAEIVFSEFSTPLAGKISFGSEALIPAPFNRFQTLEQKSLRVGGREAYFWCYRPEPSHYYPPDPEETLPPVKGMSAIVPEGMAPGLYRYLCFDTVTGETLSCGWIKHDASSRIPLPPFRIDIAVKLLYAGGRP